MFSREGHPHPSNQYGSTIAALHKQVTEVYDEAMKIDRDLSLHVLNSLTTDPTPRPRVITPLDQEERTNAVNAHAATPMPSPRDLMSKAKKSQSTFSDKAYRISRHRLMQMMPPEHIIRIPSASDEGAAVI